MQVSTFNSIKDAAKELDNLYQSLISYRLKIKPIISTEIYAANS